RHSVARESSKRARASTKQTRDEATRRSAHREAPLAKVQRDDRVEVVPASLRLTICRRCARRLGRGDCRQSPAGGSGEPPLPNFRLTKTKTSVSSVTIAQHSANHSPCRV